MVIVIDIISTKPQLNLILSVSNVIANVFFYSKECSSVTASSFNISRGLMEPEIIKFKPKDRLSSLTAGVGESFSEFSIRGLKLKLCG